MQYHKHATGDKIQGTDRYFACCQWCGTPVQVARIDRFQPATCEVCKMRKEEQDASPKQMFFDEWR